MMLHLRVYNWVCAKIFGLFWGHQFGHYGSNVRVISPVAIEGARNIYLGDNVLVAAQSCLAAVPLTGEVRPRLEIGAGSMIGRFNHIYATGGITLGKHVLTANNVYISDNLHGYRNPDVPVMQQPIVQKRHVVIGDGTWIGQNACVIGARVGRHCVVGANAVVTQDVPDHCVVVGAPAVIIRRFDPRLGAWVSTPPAGESMTASTSACAP